MTYLITIFGCYFQVDFDYRISRLPDQDIGPKACVTCQQGMITPPRHHMWDPYEFPGVHVCPTLNFVFHVGL